MWVAPARNCAHASLQTCAREALTTRERTARERRESEGRVALAQFTASRASRRTPGRSRTFSTRETEKDARALLVVRTVYCDNFEKKIRNFFWVLEIWRAEDLWNIFRENSDKLENIISIRVWIWNKSKPKFFEYQIFEWSKISLDQVKFRTSLGMMWRKV